jgi:hypothetical protein
MIFKLVFFSWWPLLLLQVLKSIMSKWHLQKISLKVKSKNKWLNMVLDVHFMTSKYSKHGFFFLFLKFMMNLGAPWKKKYKKSLIYCTFSLFWTNFFDFNKLSLHFQPLVPSWKICIKFLKIFFLKQIIGFCKSKCSLTFYKREFQKN